MANDGHFLLHSETIKIQKNFVQLWKKEDEKDGIVILSKLHRERLTEMSDAQSECCRKREKDYELKKNKCDDLI